MRAVRLSVIVPTLGRPTLTDALASIEHQRGPLDEVIVVADPAGDPAHAKHVTDRFGYRYLEAESDGLGRGGAQRRAGIAVATGTHLCFLDDDDVWLARTLELFRQVACRVPVCFRVQLPDRIAWDDHKVRPDNISGIAIVVPNQPELLGEWIGHNEDHPDRGCDYTFFAGCCERMGPPIWRREIVAVIT